LTVIVYHMLSNIEREKLVIDLYYNGRKNVRQIAQEARMSFRDIAAILKKKEAAAVNGDGSGSGSGIVAMDKIGNVNSQSNQKSTQAYKLFSEGRKPVDVAIQLSLSEKEVTKYYMEYWRLKGIYGLYHIYQESKGNLSYFLKIYTLVKRQAITADNIEWFVNMVNLGTYNIPDLQKQYSKLQDEVQLIDHQKVVSKAELDNMNNQISILRRTMYQLSATCNDKRNEIAYLKNQIQVLEGYVTRLD
jgi:predicted transcriptional regulator